MTQCDNILKHLRMLANPDNVVGMARYGINARNTLGVSMTELRTLAKTIGENHALAQQLWASGIHEARILASIVADPKLVTEEQMEHWVRDFDSWDVCDQCCGNLFDKTPFAYEKATAWSARTEEFVKRAGFVLMAELAIHDKKATDIAFEPFFFLIKREASDDRHMVKKAVNWALRQIGKRNRHLNRMAIVTAEEIRQLDTRAARWIANDALRELMSDKVQQRLRQ